MTPEQAFEKWWDKAKNRCSGTADSYSPWFSHECAFIAGQQYQEINQLMVLADIRKAVGDGEGRLSQEELVKRIEGLVSQSGWQPIETAQRDGSQRIIIAQFSESGELIDMDHDAAWKMDRESWEIPEPYWYWESAYGRVEEPTHWMPLPAGPVKSVTTEKEEA